MLLVGSDKPSMTRSRIAMRLIEMVMASRTRWSRNGFFSSGLPSLSVTKGVFSRWSRFM
jgi:hypothetical protein